MIGYLSLHKAARYLEYFSELILPLVILQNTSLKIIYVFYTVTLTENTILPITQG